MSDDVISDAFSVYFRYLSLLVVKLLLSYLISKHAEWFHWCNRSYAICRTIVGIY